jgi:hypothetical protein
MKQQPTQFGQALQLSEARQQIAGLQAQVEKLKSDIKALRDTDRAIFDDQDREMAELKALVGDLVEGLQDCWDNEYSLEELKGLKARAQELLKKE